MEPLPTVYWFHLGYSELFIASGGDFSDRLPGISANEKVGRTHFFPNLLVVSGDTLVLLSKNDTGSGAFSGFLLSTNLAASVFLLILLGVNTQDSFGVCVLLVRRISHAQ